MPPHIADPWERGGGQEIIPGALPLASGVHLDLCSPGSLFAVDLVLAVTSAGDGSDLQSALLVVSSALPGLRQTLAAVVFIDRFY